MQKQSEEEASLGLTSFLHCLLLLRNYCLDVVEVVEQKRHAGAAEPFGRGLICGDEARSRPVSLWEALRLLTSPAQVFKLFGEAPHNRKRQSS